MKFYMVLQDHEHRGRTHNDDGTVDEPGIDCSHEGLVVDPNPPTPLGKVQWVGLFYAKEDVLTLLHHGCCIREVTTPADAQIAVFKLRKGQVIYRADKVILGPRIELNDASIAALLNEGANVHVNQDLPLRQAVRHGAVGRMRVFMGFGADIHAKRDEALKSAVELGRGAALSELMKKAEYSDLEKDEVLHNAVRHGQLDCATRMALYHGANVAKDDYGIVTTAAFTGEGVCFEMLMEQVPPDKQQEIVKRVDDAQAQRQTPPEGMPEGEEWTPAPDLPPAVTTVLDSKRAPK